jgi:pilus assembly protein CpaC
MSGFSRFALVLAGALSASAILVSPAAASEPYGAPNSAQFAVLAGAPVHPGPLGPAGPSQTVSIDLSGPAAPVRTLSLPRGKSAVIDLPTDARDVLVSDPKVADVVLSTPRRIYVLGVGAGQTDAAFMDASGRQILRLNIRVDQDVSALGETLNRLLPGATIRIESVNDSIVLSGEAPNAAAADKAIRLAQALVTKPEQVINMLTVTESEQVMLKVRIVEVNRTIIKQLGVNLNAVLGQVGMAQFSLANAAVWGVNGSLLGGLTGGYNLNTTQQPELQIPCPTGLSGNCFQIVHGNNTGLSNAGTATLQTTAGSTGLNQASAMLQAFEESGLVRTLAEPNLTAVSGESAKFLVGGEFPVPIGEDSTGRITVEFKQYGVGLGFTPVVMSKGRISLKISTEVSELTNTGSFTLTTSASTTSTTTTSPSLSIPGLNVRRAETTVELPSGEGMMIAGLLQANAKQTLATLPGVQNLPVLGALFRSRDFLNEETELVVIVTPYLVKPVNPNLLQTPADDLVIASDLETTLLGRLNASFGKSAPPPKSGAYQGPIGYVVD